MIQRAAGMPRSFWPGEFASTHQFSGPSEFDAVAKDNDFAYRAASLSFSDTFAEPRCIDAIPVVTRHGWLRCQCSKIMVSVF